MRWLGTLLIVALLTTTSFAQESPRPEGVRPRDKENKLDKKLKADKKLPRKGALPVEVTPQVEEAALSFAKEHFAELANLLEHLKAHSKENYERAIGELYRTSERLALAKQKDKARYELELEAWKIDSRIRLIVARMSMNEDHSALKQELRSELEKKHELHLRRLLLERERAQRRLQNLDAQIERLKRQREKIPDQADQLVKTVKKDKRAQRPRGNRAKGAKAGSSEIKTQTQK